VVHRLNFGAKNQRHTLFLLVNRHDNAVTR